MKQFLRDAVVGWNMLSLGGESTGLQFHTHGASWLGLVYGAKEWWIFAPAALPDAVAAAMMPLHAAPAWAPPLTDLLAASAPGGGAWHCVQREGEALYVPAGFAHATRNFSPSIGVGGQAIWSAEERRAAGRGDGGGGLLSSWLGLGSGGGGETRDFFSHVNTGLAAAMEGDHATAASEYSAATRLCNTSVELHAKLFETQLALLAEATKRRAGSSTISALRNAAAASVNAGVDATFAALANGATNRTAAAFLHRLGAAMVDAATKHSPPRWEPQAAFGVGEQVLAQAARLALPDGGAEGEPVAALLVGEIALLRGAAAAATEQWQRAVEQLELAAEHLDEDHIRQRQLGRSPRELLAMVEQRVGAEAAPHRTGKGKHEKKKTKKKKAARRP